MKLSYNWLRSLVNLEGADPKSVAEALTLSGSKVETVTYPGAEIENVVIGRVLSLTKHPNADRLTVCQIDVGKDTPLQIVTGAANLFPGALIPVALDGAELPCGKSIHTGIMRGERSEGMLCSGAELLLDAHDQPGADADGILILSEGVPGEDAVERLMLSDAVIDFEITNNRPDCLSVRGLARETAATLGRMLTLPEPKCVDGEGGIGDHLTVTVEAPELCPRYAARMVTDVKIEASPLWMRRALRAMGLRPINNIVDITNYVMLEFGQPMHAFDYACVDGGELRIRNAKEGETLETLDGQPRRLDPSMLVIADSGKATAVAGVMGGAASEITEKTRAIVFESACFDGVSVRKTAQTLGMRTDASSRFEKGLDIEGVIPALERACELVEALGAGKVLGGLIDCRTRSASVTRVPLCAERINKHLGVSLRKGEILALLSPLGFSADGDDILVPSWRGDVCCWQDLSEEVARMYGYDRIPATLTVSKNEGALTPWQRFRERVSALCQALGYDESLTLPFLSTADLDLLRLPPEDTRREARSIQNPTGEETSLLRTFALPSLVASLGRNAAARNPEVRLYELATVFIDEGAQLPLEDLRLVMGAYGGGVDFFSIKGDFEALTQSLGIPPLRFEISEDPCFHPGRCAALFSAGKQIGVLGELHPTLCEALACPERVCALEISLASLYAARPYERPYQPLPKYPASPRDLALVCPAELPHAAVLETIRASGGPLLRDCELFDVYTGGQLPEGKRSLAYRLTFRADDRTLRDEESDAALAMILKELESRHGITLRA